MGNYIEQVFPSIKAVNETGISFGIFFILVVAGACVFNVYFSIKDLKRVFKHRHSSFSQNTYIIFKTIGIILSIAIFCFIGSVIIDY